MKIAVLNVATGKYIKFVDKLHSDMREKLFPGHELHFFLFTDDDEKQFPPDVTKVEVARKGFPGDTLYRYHYFLKAEEQLKKYDFILYTDVDMAIHKNVGDEIISDLLAVHHPGFYKRMNGTFERRKKSRACLPHTVVSPYLCGGVQGGRASDYLEACADIKNKIDQDDVNGIMAIWHDESHWNSYLHKCGKKVTVLGPEYCYYEFPWTKHLEESKIIEALDKDHEEIRNDT